MIKLELQKNNLWKIVKKDLQQYNYSNCWDGIVEVCKCRLKMKGFFTMIMVILKVIYCTSVFLDTYIQIKKRRAY